MTKPKTHQVIHMDIDFDAKGNIIMKQTHVMEEQETERETADRLERKRFEKKWGNLTPKEKSFYVILDEMVESLHDAGVDISYFPMGANYALIDYAKKLRSREARSEKRTAKRYADFFSDQLAKAEAIEKESINYELGDFPTEQVKKMQADFNDIFKDDPFEEITRS